MAIEEVGIKLDLQGRADAAKGLKDTDADIAKLGTTADTAGDKLRKGLGAVEDVGKKVGAGVKVAALSLGGIATATTAYLVKTGVQYNLLEQTSRAAMTTLLGSRTAANQMADDVRAFGKTSPFPRQAFISATQQLLGFGFSAKSIIPTLKVINDTTAALGGNADTISTIADVFASIKSQGKLSGDQVQRLGAIGVNVYGILAQASGKSVEEVQKAVSAGAVKADDAIAVLEHGMNARFAGAGANVKATWSGATDSVKASLRDLGSDLVEPFVSREGGGYAITWANDIATRIRAVDAMVPGVMAKLSTGAAAARNGGSGQLASTWERIGYWAERAELVVAGFDWAGLGHRIDDAFHAGGIGGFFHTLLGSGPGAKRSLQGIGSSLDALRPVAAAAAKSLPSVSTVLHLLAGALGEAAKHSHLLVEVMPILIGGYLVYRSTLAVSTIASKVLKDEQVLSTLVSWRSVYATRANAAANRMLASEMMRARGATEEEVAAANASAIAAGRSALRNGALRVVTLAQSAASKLAAGAQWALNAAMDANPVMIAVLAVGALVAVSILAYKHVGWFRDAVNGAWGGIEKAAEWTWKWVAPFTPLGVGLKVAIKGVKELRDHGGDLVDMLKLGAKWLGKISDAMGIPGLGSLLGKISGDGDGSTTNGGSGSGKQARHRAGGGAVVAGQPYIVGEHRPEVFTPTTSGVITPRVPTQATSSAAGGTGASVDLSSLSGGNVTVQLILDGQVLTEVVLDRLAAMQARS